MAVEIVMPRVDMDMTSGRMGRWHAAGPEVKRKGRRPGAAIQGMAAEALCERDQSVVKAMMLSPRL